MQKLLFILFENQTEKLERKDKNISSNDLHAIQNTNWN
ncbi:hypothetical protein SZ39_4847 [Bacillus mycoides]|nr:hypothetical protein bcere0014_9610 [Bacillus cereus BDRD-ST196]EEM00540.1 hypothetical protein bmyco0001_9760 [Bacillus mycoides DSM 2048]KIV67344.1 hypothetical protein SZ39_4847 [Bacillus mycoides]